MNDELPGEDEATRGESGTGSEFSYEERRNIVKNRWRSGLFIGGVVGVALIGVFALLMFSGGAIERDAYARGLITVLFSFGVIVMALILVLTMLLQGPAITEQESKERGNRFQRVKEILTLLLGILGTVVGFYFGTASGESVNTPTISDVTVSATELGEGEDLSITALINGGKAPFQYVIEFDHKDMASRESKTSEYWIKEVVKVPKMTSDGGNVKVTVKITDDLGQATTYPQTIEFAIKNPKTVNN